MKNLCIALLLLIPEISLASSVKKFHIGSFQYPVVEVEHGIWVNEECGNTCMALQAASSIRNKTIKPLRARGGINPGSWSCKKQFNGKVFIAVDDHDNQQSFCKFRDGSFVNTGALY